jgi:hypothetical protein
MREFVYFLNRIRTWTGGAAMFKKGLGSLNT